MILQFGRWKGRHIREVPENYLVWMLSSFNGLWPEHREAIEQELTLRRSKRETEYEKFHQQNEPKSEQQKTNERDLEAIIKRWHRELAMKWHPDRGGSKEGMQAINDAYSRLKKLLGLC
jgi:Putative quorum-sensing-regulated virulence factor